MTQGDFQILECNDKLEQQLYKAIDLVINRKMGYDVKICGLEWISWKIKENNKFIQNDLLKNKRKIINECRVIYQ